MSLASMREFLTSGHLGAIRLGMSADSIRLATGNPDDVSVRRDPEIWKFGSLQLVFRRADCESIATEAHLYFAPPFGLPDAVTPIDWMPSAFTTLVELRAKADLWNLAVTSEPLLSSHEQMAISIGKYAIAIFAWDTATLVSIHVVATPRQGS